MRDNFVYDSLYLSNDSIRLLRILPGSQTEEIHCLMNQFPASERPPYCAVSYSWGKPDQPRQLILNDQQFYVRKNLWWLLYHLRHMNEVRHLWIDAICIDQASIKERNHQVALMSKIYQSAETVLAWLGPASEDSNLALDFLMELPNITQPVSITCSTHKVFDAEQPLSDVDVFRKSSQLEISVAKYKRWHDIDRRCWEALAKLCKREYWHRTWIIQEILLASKIDLLCGGMKISWKELEHMANVIPHNPRSLVDSSVVDTVTEILGSLPFCFIGQRVKQQAAPLSTLLGTYQSSQCVDPRDKVYAMLGLASDCRYGGALVADYSKDIFQLYMDVMRFCGNTTSKERIYFSLLIIKILRITPSMAAAFLNQQYDSGWLPLRFHRPDYVYASAANMIELNSLMEVQGTRIGWIIDIECSRSNHGGSFLEKVMAHIAKCISKPDGRRPTNFQYCPLLLRHPSEIVHATHVGSDAKPGDADDGVPKKITILLKGKGRTTGIACSEARGGDEAYQFDKSDVALIFRETEWGFEVVGEAIVECGSDDGIKMEIPYVQRFMFGTLDLLAITRRGDVSGRYESGDS